MLFDGKTGRDARRPSPSRGRSPATGFTVLDGRQPHGIKCRLKNILTKFNAYDDFAEMILLV